MIQLQVVRGGAPASTHTIRRFPCLIGRAAEAQFRVEGEGVWDRHLELQLHVPEGFELTVQPPALASLNGQPFQSALLHNGDLIELGSVKLRFWLAEPTQRSLRAREWFTWISLGALCVGQITLIYWLVR
jgi:hypothetical protein